MIAARLLSLARVCVPAAAVLLSGCSNLSGLDGKSEFACAAPDGVSCMSISGVSANVDRGNLPSSIKQREQEELSRDLNTKTVRDQPENPATSREADTNEKKSGALRVSYNPSSTLSPANMMTLGSGTPIRIPPKELRIWIAPTEDTDGDLHEQRYVYVVVNDGRWMVDATRMNTRNKYMRFQPVGNQATETTGAPKEQPSPQRDIRPVQAQAPAQAQSAP